MSTTDKNNFKEDFSGDEKKKKIDWPKEIISWICIVAAAFIIAFVITHFIIIKSEIVSGSMETTIMTGDHVLGNRLAYLFSDPERGDIIFFQSPEDEDDIYIKRIIGLPGETVYIRDGKVYIDDNETPLEEPYLHEKMKQKQYTSEKIPENCYFVMGDNRNVSADSRGGWFVPKDEIYGKAWLIYVPHLSTLEDVEYSIDKKD